MTRPLWDAAEAAAATGGVTTTEWAARGVSIDSRSLMPGDLFVALRGPTHDGHDFAAAAFARGAAAAIVDREIAGLPHAAPLLRVGDTLAGLTALGAAARARSGARILAVTGSVGKTGTKELLRLALAACGPTAAAAGSLNNHWGVPLSLARMPPDAAYGVFELGMNHPGEIAALSRLVRPHVALITTVEPAHLGFFPSLDAIADAKAEIFEGLEPGGIAVLNRDNPYYPRLAAAAERAGAARIVGFGSDRAAVLRLVECIAGPEGSEAAVALDDRLLRFGLPVTGRHWIVTALAALAAAFAAGADLDRAPAAFALFAVPPGRGQRIVLPWGGGVLTLYDESYNASPASMRAAFAVLAATAPAPGGRRIVVLGDMLELGEAAPRLHRELAAPLAAARVDRAFLVGAEMAALDAVLPQALRGGLWRSADEVIPALLRFLQPGDVVTVKGSYGVRTGRIVEALCARSAEPET